jgi:YhcH/YjgK/YiaL family protein
MIIDQLKNADLYKNLNPGIAFALQYLQQTDLSQIAPGKYALQGDEVFMIVQEYDTLNEAGEQMEAHRNYTDVQYMIKGQEKVGLAQFKDQSIAKAYDEQEDYLQVSNPPDFYCTLQEGCFMVFFPGDLHAPCLQLAEKERVKKAVIKVRNT